MGPPFYVKSSASDIRSKEYGSGQPGLTALSEIACEGEYAAL